jgi:hypothetical protein
MTFRLEESFDIDETIKEVFLGDVNLFLKYHYESPTDHAEASQYTSLYTIRDVPRETVFYSIYLDDILFGYIAFEHNNIWDIAFSIKYREGDYINKFYNYFFREVLQEGTIRLCERNHRDINLLLKSKLARPVAFDRYIGKRDYTELAQEGAVKNKEKHILYIPLSQIILSFGTNEA